MQTFFVLVKCEPGHAYDVAADAVDRIEPVAEVYSITGQYDLLIKCHLEAGQDVGKFVVSHLQTLKGVRDTFTMLTFKAFS